MEVRVSGAVLSSIFLQVASSKGDVEGFLMGEICSRTVKAVTDSNSQNVKHERIASIQGMVPCQNVFSFYDAVGRIREQKLVNILCKREKEVIGWYKFRRNCSTQVSMREKIVHHNLIHALDFSKTKEFLFAVFSSTLSTSMSTHTFIYSVHCWSDYSIFEQVPMNIINLGDTSHSDYRLTPRNAPVKSQIYRSVIDSYRSDFIDDDRCIQQVTGIHSMYITTLKKLQELAEEVKQSEHEVSSLRSKVTTLESRLTEKRELMRQSTACQDNAGTSSIADNHRINELTKFCTDETSPDTPTKVKIKSSSVSVHGSKTVVILNAKRLNGNCDIIQEEPMDTEHDEKFMDSKPNKIPNKEKFSSKGRRKQEAPKRVESKRKISHGGTDSSDDETQDYILPEEMDQGAAQSLSPTF